MSGYACAPGCGIALPRTAPIGHDSLAMLLEIAAIFLTPTTDATFTAAELIAMARETCEGEVTFTNDVATAVISAATWLDRRPDGTLVLA